MHSYLPSESELSFLVRLGMFVLSQVMIFLGARYIFGKTGATTVVLAGLGLFGLLALGLSIAPTRVSVAQLSPIGLPSAVSVSKPPSSATPSPAQPPSAAIALQQVVGSNAPLRISELPAWMKNPPHEGTLGAGYCKYVLTSQLYATPEEAETELNRHLALDVQQSLKVGGSPAVGWSPTADDLRNSGLVTEQVIETVPMKVGEFDTSVQKISWLVEFKPASQLALLSRWQSSEAQRRSKLILSALAAISGVMGVSAFALRRRQTHPLPASSQMA